MLNFAICSFLYFWVRYPGNIHAINKTAVMCSGIALILFIINAKVFAAGFVHMYVLRERNVIRHWITVLRLFMVYNYLFLQPFSNGFNEKSCCETDGITESLKPSHGQKCNKGFSIASLTVAFLPTLLGENIKSLKHRHFRVMVLHLPWLDSKASFFPRWSKQSNICWREEMDAFVAEPELSN